MPLRAGTEGEQTLFLELHVQHFQAKAERAGGREGSVEDEEDGGPNINQTTTRSRRTVKKNVLKMTPARRAATSEIKRQVTEG